MIDVYVVLVDLMAGLIGLWVFQLVRRDRLYVGYGVIFLIAIGTAIIPLTFPRVLGPFIGLSRLAERSIVVISLVLLFVVMMLIYVMSQLTLLSNRVTTLTQELAIRAAISNSPPLGDGTPASTVEDASEKPLSGQSRQPKG